MCTEIKTVRGYLTAILPFQIKSLLMRKPSRNPLLLFRGQQKMGCNQLVATLGEQWRDDLHTREKEVLERVKKKFNKFVFRMGGRVNCTAIWYNTRFLDWSSDCLIALWFAVSQKEEAPKHNESVVWVLETRPKDFEIVEDEPPIPNGKGSVTKIFTPLQIGKRAQLQESYMMRQVYEGSKGGSVSKIVSVERNDLFRGRCWRIPITSNPKIKLKLHDELKRCGYDNKSIFPIDDLLKDKNKSWKELKDECNAILDKGISI